MSYNDNSCVPAVSDNLFWYQYPAPITVTVPMEDKFKKAFKVVKMLMNEGIVPSSISVREFLELVDKIEKVL